MSGDTALYVWGSYFMGLAMMLTELVLLYLRERAIRGQFGRLRDASARAANDLGAVSLERPAADS